MTELETSPEVETEDFSGELSDEALDRVEGGRGGQFDASTQCAYTNLTRG